MLGVHERNVKTKRGHKKVHENVIIWKVFPFNILIHLLSITKEKKVNYIFYLETEVFSLSFILTL